MTDAGAAGGVRRGRRLPAVRRPPAGRRARRRPADHRAPRPARHRERVPPAACGSPRPETMEVVRMVLVGQVNRDVVGLINAHGPFAVGLSGEDAHLFTAERRTAVVDGEEVDIGLVGDVVDGRPGRGPRRCSTTGRIPVVATVARGADGADLQRQRRHRRRRPRRRARRREARRAHRRRGPLRRLAGDQRASVISEITADELERLLPACPAAWSPKMEACLRAVRGGVPQAHVLDGRVPHALLLEVFTDDGRRHDGDCRDGAARRDRRPRRPLGRALMRQLRHARRSRWSAAGAARSGTPTATTTST